MTRKVSEELGAAGDGRPFASGGDLAAPVLELRGIRKVFPGVVANDDVSLKLRSGEILALLGENGAGKSTLMNVVYGLLSADAGEVLVDGARARIRAPRHAIDLGIGMVHQHFMLVEPLTVTENIILGREPGRGGVIDLAGARAAVQALSERYRLRIDPDARIEDLSVGMQQRVEILKALYQGARILILDEPTAVLTPQEVRELFAVVRSLVAEGLAVVFITHKLEEVLAVADRIAVMRDGHLVGQTTPSEVDRLGLAKMMVGRDVSLTVEKAKASPADVVLRVEELRVRGDRGLEAVRGLSLEVRGGEVVAVAGVDGNGQRELVEAIVGLRRPSSGRVMIGGRDMTNAPPRDSIAAGVSHVPEDRHRRGLVLEFDLAENVVLGDHTGPPYARLGVLDTEAIGRVARERIKEYDVRTPSERVAAGNLSGGNQQKLVLARELGRDPELLIAAQPTRGLDVGAIEFVHRRVIAERDAGKAVLLVSFELEEVLALGDRILVLYEGRVVKEFAAGEADEQTLGLYMTGAGGDAGGAAPTSGGGSR